MTKQTKTVKAWLIVNDAGIHDIFLKKEEFNDFLNSANGMLAIKMLQCKFTTGTITYKIPK